MACTRPIKGYRSRRVNPLTKKRSIVFNAREGLLDQPVDLPCGRCIFCRLEHSRQNAMRCVHEASLYERNCFITLTYAPANLPPGKSIDKTHPVGFLKRLRARFPLSKIRSFGCAEYGCEGCNDPRCRHTALPHYHILLFNFDFPDKEISRQQDGFKYYTSKILDDTWSFGRTEISDLTFESAAYVARYVTKKLDHGGVEVTRIRFIPSYSDVATRQVRSTVAMEHERSVCVSRRPGIGSDWFLKWGKTDVLPHDRVVLRGRLMRPPKYYDKLGQAGDSKYWRKLMRRRREQALEGAPRRDDHERRWRTIEVCKEASFKLLKRGMENGKA